MYTHIALILIQPANMEVTRMGIPELHTASVKRWAESPQYAWASSFMCMDIFFNGVVTDCPEIIVHPHTAKRYIALGEIH